MTHPAPGHPGDRSHAEHSHADHSHADHSQAEHSQAEHSHAGGDAELARLLDLDPVALADSWARIHAVVEETVSRPPALVVDLGAGTGTGASALARLFPDATVVAVDSNPAMPERVAATTGAAAPGRVRTVVADLDHGWPDLGLPAPAPVDLVWASMALHHLGDPDRTLGEIAHALRPGGLLVAVEFDAPVRVLGRGAADGVEERAHAALTMIHRERVPEIGSRWAERFAAAGLSVVVDEPVTIDVRPPHTEAAVRYAALWLARLAVGVEGRLDPADVATLARLGTADGIATADVHLRGTRTVTVGRRVD